ncbi:MAG: DUF5050 domain-containing protein [Acetatifactor sp.]|nr:DUF5050 domain-containing protein [Acetatifactor sp.]
MSKNLKAILIVLFVCVVVGFIAATSLLSRSISLNPEDTVGNTAGNLNNEGLFCEYDGYVYFTNPSDGFKLYKMTPSEGGIEKVFDLKVRNILAGGKYLFFYQTGGSGSAGIGTIVSSRSLLRTDLKGKNDTSLNRGNVSYSQLVGNNIYMLASDGQGNHFIKMKIDKSDEKELSTSPIVPTCAYNGSIYFTGTEDDLYLYRLDTSTDVVSPVLQHYVWNPCVDGDYIYFMDVENDYRLCRFNFISNGEIEVLTEDRLDCFNVGNGFIYYQKNSQTEPELRCMRTDGSDNFALAEGNYTSINMTSQFVYFKQFGDDNNLYHSFLGSRDYSAFRP